jgi:hypothetical protein
MENVVKEKRVKDPPVKSPIPLAQSKSNPVTTAASPSSSRPENNKAMGKKKAAKKNKGNARIGIGDVVSLPATAFDGVVPGSFSKKNPGPCFGRALDMKNGVVSVEWLDGLKDNAKQRDLTLEARKKDEQVAFESKEKTNWPKDFFKVWFEKIGGHGCRRSRNSSPAGTRMTLSPWSTSRMCLKMRRWFH